MIIPLDWLLAGPAYVRHAVQTGLIKGSDTASSHDRMAEDPAVRALVAELSGWPGSLICSHKSAGHPLHKLAFLADLGLRHDDPGLAVIVERVAEHRQPDGPFQVLMNVPVHLGGTGRDGWAWALCDAPTILYAMASFGLSGDPRVQIAADYLTDLARPNGWPCAVSAELGRFRGPGRKDDCCPYATLVMLKALSVIPERLDSPQTRQGAEGLLQLWAERRHVHPYLFYMGTDFCKMKAPFVWYDLLHVADVLTRFPWLLADPRLLEMIGLIQAKADGEGRFTAESSWTAWKGWEFGQKKAPSRWLTYLAHRVIARLPGTSE